MTPTTSCWNGTPSTPVTRAPPAAVTRVFMSSTAVSISVSRSPASGSPTRLDPAGAGVVRFTVGVVGVVGGPRPSPLGSSGAPATAGDDVVTAATTRGGVAAAAVGDCGAAGSGSGAGFGAAGAGAG